MQLQQLAKGLKLFKENGQLDDESYAMLYETYLNHGEMPYGVAKARTGDPYEWVCDRLDRLLVLGAKDFETLVLQDIGIHPMKLH